MSRVGLLVEGVCGIALVMIRNGALLSPTFFLGSDAYLRAVQPESRVQPIKTSITDDGVMIDKWNAWVKAIRRKVKLCKPRAKLFGVMAADCEVAFDRVLADPRSQLVRPKPCVRADAHGAEELAGPPERQRCAGDTSGPERRLRARRACSRHHV